MHTLGFSCDFEGDQFFEIIDWFTKKGFPELRRERLWLIDGKPFVPACDFDFTRKVVLVRNEAQKRGVNCFYRALRYSGDGWCMDYRYEHSIDGENIIASHVLEVEDKYLAIELKLTLSQVTYGPYFPT
jgi:hypothetical protein